MKTLLQVKICRGGNDEVNKVYVLQIIFLIVQIFAAIPLTAAVFGDMNPDIISVSAFVIWVGMLGNIICAIIRAVQESEINFCYLSIMQMSKTEFSVRLS